MSEISAQSFPDKHNRFTLVVIVAVGVALGVAAFRQFDPPKFVLYNDTPSMPLGFYRLREIENLQDLSRGDIVVYSIPDNVIELVRERQYMNPDVPLLKPLTAQSGDYVCTSAGQVVVNESFLGAIRQVDRFDRPLPIHEYCARVPEGQFYSFSQHSQSFDSRHYGSIATSAILATATPLWTWDAKE